MTRKSWLVGAVRVFLAVVFALYGTAKFVGLQFAVSPSALRTQLGEATPYAVAWYFFHLSPL